MFVYSTSLPWATSIDYRDDMTCHKGQCQINKVTASSLTISTSDAVKLRFSHIAKYQEDVGYILVDVKSIGYCPLCLRHNNLNLWRLSKLIKVMRCLFDEMKIFGWVELHNQLSIRFVFGFGFRSHWVGIRRYRNCWSQYSLLCKGLSSL